jgi:hypothetical protein
MLTHIVCFKYKSDISEQARADHRRRLTSLKQVTGVIDLKLGADVVRGQRSYDTGLVITFPDRAALDAYQKDALHVPVAQFGTTLCDSIVSVDFE